MGQAPSSFDSERPEPRVEDPETPPRGLALIAHGRFGNMNGFVVRKLAEYFREERRLRVVTWDDLVVWDGRDFHADWTIWIGDVAHHHYNLTRSNRQHFLHQAMENFKNDFPDVGNPELFICGYSAGAIAAGCTRPQPASLASHFTSIRYILVSYPVESNFVIGVFKTGSNFGSVEGLLQGHGWEGLPAEFNGAEPKVDGVLVINGSNDRGPFFGVWSGILWGKNSRGKLSQVVVDGANHTWDYMEHRLVDGVGDWLA
ncbi:hypothetical protein KVR01_007657 [Diaporthe batatas]|uniref:uncharacterized protein n=1 Tax=Diaporthe batatas TaxID=748121 RepID=UPI001D0468D5|nr:uncharacterized protein KVR01_007657 [Diaporthe batatas]KAG8163179.1 hypothetical protein KVR01_007657 [Diaporthe batatas]